MKRIFIGLLTLLFVTFLPAFAEESVKLEIIYPKNGAKINASSFFIVGNTEADATLTINQQKAKVFPNGAFVQMLNLHRGINNINITSKTQHAEKEIKYFIIVPEYEKTIPTYPVKIEESSIYPNKNLLMKQDENITVSFKASTSLKANFSIGEKIKNIPMTEQTAKNMSTAPVYGKETKLSSMPVKGIYKGFYKIKPEDNFDNEIIKLELNSVNEKISVDAKGKISTICPNFPPIIAEVTKDYAVTRNAPNQNRLTPLPQGTMLNLTGKIGNVYRFKYSDNFDGWISENDIKIFPSGDPIPESLVSLLNIDSDKNYMYLRIPLVQKLPFLLEQTSDNQINLKLFGATAGVDLFSYDDSENFIKEFKWVQESKDCLKLVIKTNSIQFWGYKYYYDGDTLVLRLRKPPDVHTYSPLEGKIICIDPGHGGTEAGAVGPTGIPEKLINFGIADKLRKILEAKGAKVIMTRTSDETVGLNDRINIATSNEAQVIISIHNNSLPDGRNPYQEHGTSTYYYHSQSLPFAKIIHQSLIQATGFKDFGLFYSSFVLTRPTEALSILLEVGFMINPEEYNLLITPEFQKKTAAAIALGLENFFLTTTDKDIQENK